MKKRLSIVLCMTLMATSLLAGCKKKEEAPEPTETVSEAEPETETKTGKDGMMHCHSMDCRRQTYFTKLLLKAELPV